MRRFDLYDTIALVLDDVTMSRFYDFFITTKISLAARFIMPSLVKKRNRKKIK